ncbi:MAG: hypothetical protein VXZ35_05520, partial [Pseudomonadota bacterium]|nr:hypothetical protein [Pseudomonadota bacterium]
MFSSTVQQLPIFDVLYQLQRALVEGDDVVLEAPPGAGKTTIVPLALLDAGWSQGKKIIVL